MSASEQRRKKRSGAARRRAAATAAAKPERKLASFRENAGENGAKVQNGASAVDWQKSGGAQPIADLRGGGGIDTNTGSKLPPSRNPHQFPVVTIKQNQNQKHKGKTSSTR